MRERDIIDVRLGTEHQVDMQIAWLDLRDLVLERTGIDLNGRHPYRVQVKPVRKSGNRQMQAIVVGPQRAHDLQTLMDQSFISFFGQLPVAAIEHAESAARSGDRATFAMPMSMATPC